MGHNIEQAGHVGAKIHRFVCHFLLCLFIVIPAKAGIFFHYGLKIPAFAGMTA
jgi:hypothetical protein